MDDEHRKILREARVFLVKDMDVQKVLLYMASSHLFSESDEANIKAEKTQQSQCEMLLNILTRKGNKAFNIFKEALSAAGQPHLVNTLKKSGK